MKKIRKNDEVIVITGKDKGKRGIVSGSVGASQLMVAGLNIAKKAVKPNPVIGVVGGIVEVEMPISRSNVALFNGVTGKADRVGFRVVDGVKVRVFKSNGEVVGR